MAWSARPTLEAGGYPRADELEAMLDRIEFLSDPPRAQLRQTSAQTFGTGAFVALTFDAEDWDNYGGHSTATNTSRYTCQVAGIYVFSGKISFAANTTGRRATRWSKNGSDVTGGQTAIIATSTSDIEHPATTIQISLAVGDYVELLGYQESGGNLATVVSGGQQPLMTVRWIGES